MENKTNKLFDALDQKKVFIFDFDGTLTDSNNLIFKAMQMVCLQYGQNFTEQDFLEVKDKPSPFYLEKMKKMTGQDLDPSILTKQYIDACDEILKTEKLSCFNYVKPLLKTFENKTIVIASNNTSKFLWDRLKEMKIDKFFSKVFACGIDIKNKQVLYEHTQELLGAKPQDCALFEDTQKYLHQAKINGILTVGILQENDKKTLDADFFVKANKGI